MKKSFTPDQVAAIENEAYENGMSVGRHDHYEMFDRVVKKLRNSIEDVWSIEMQASRDNLHNIERLEFAINTLVQLEDMMEAETYERTDLR
jgi:uncharacterized protein YqeY